jgi:RNA polymerase sigma-70 factor (sigma-E family)
VTPAAEQFSLFVQDRGDDLLRLAVLLLGSTSAGEDACQTTLERVYARLSRGQHIDDLFAYARQTLIRVAYREWRHRKDKPEQLMADIPDGLAGDDSSRVVVHQDLLRSLGCLPKQQRAALVLRYFADLSESETARLLGCSVGAAKSHTARGLEKLRAAPRQDVDFSGGA